MRSVHEGIKEFMEIAGQPIRDLAEIPLTGTEQTEAETTRALLLARTHLRLAVDALKSEGCAGSERAMRGRFVLSETAEWCTALAEFNVVELADASADITYTVVGTDVQFGIPSVEVFDEVQRSNVAKFVPCADCAGHGGSSKTSTCGTCRGYGRIAIKDTQGKVQKWVGWTPPDIAGVLAAAKEQK